MAEIVTPIWALKKGDKFIIGNHTYFKFSNAWGRDEKGDWIAVSPTEVVVKG